MTDLPVLPLEIVPSPWPPNQPDSYMVWEEIQDERLVLFHGTRSECEKFVQEYRAQPIKRKPRFTQSGER